MFKVDAKMTMPDSQRYPKKLCLIKNELDINVYNFENCLFFNCGFSTKVTVGKRQYLPPE